MVSFNRAVLAGNLTEDPKLRFTQNGVPVCSFSIAVNRVKPKNSEAVDFFNVSAWRQLGETIANYKKKGDPILVEGRLQYRSWQAQDGAKRNAVDVVADNVQFLSRGTLPQTQAEVSAPAKVPAGTTAEGGWGVAKKLQEGEGDNTASKEED